MSAYVAFALLTLVACGDDPVAPEEHLDPSGFAIESGGVELLRHLDGAVVAPLVLENGATYEITVVFLDEDGDPLPHEEHEPGEDEESLRVTIANGSIVSWTEEDHDEGEEEERLEFHGELAALTVGNTQMQLCLEHEDHCDYESPFIPIEVE